jgi:P pilus assembly chaperone PapD
MFVSTNPFRHIAQTAMAALAVGSLLSSVPVSAQGDLLIAPTRVILDGRRGTEVILSNIGGNEATYRISLELRRMTVDGDLEPVERDQANAVEQAALEMIRYAPRRVVLPPGQPQAVRLSARPGAELPDGEYRVHMAFNAIPDTKPVVTDGSDTAQSGGISIKLTPIYGITIPIIIRKGKLEATAAVSDPKITRGPGGAQLKLHMVRSGQASTYGELRVMRPGSSEPLYLARGIAIYPELTGRDVILPLSPEQAAAMTGPLRFEYRELPEAGGALLASVEGSLP